MKIKTDYLKQKKIKNHVLISVLTILILLIIVIIYINDNHLEIAKVIESVPVKQDVTKELKQYNEIEEKLQNYIFADDTIEQAVRKDLITSDQHTDFIVFLSLCNSIENSTVISATGRTLAKAWKNVNIKAKEFVDKNNFNTVWLKVDIVNYMKKIQAEDLPKMISIGAGHLYGFFRLGIAFDYHFGFALLEAEINGNEMIDYDFNLGLDLNRLNEYLSFYNRKKIEKLPNEFILFSCRGYIYDGTGCYTLHHNQDYNYGRRIIDEVNGDYINSLIGSNTKYLINSIQADGKFIYGQYPINGQEMSGYNILRHAGTLWSLVIQYDKMSENREVHQKAIESALTYLLGEIVYDQNASEVAYVVERKSKEIKLGGNGIALCALIVYMEKFQNEKYLELCEMLGNGILSMMNQDTGKYYHVLYYGDDEHADFSGKNEFRTVYYDGEATLALLKLCGLTGNDKWLTAAKGAVENFIREDYVQYHDHWVAYAMNEITKYIEDSRYYAFALRNVKDNLAKIYYSETASQTFLELLMATFDLYDRMIERYIQVDDLTEFPAEYFIKIIFHRAKHMLNGYFYPEYAMYLKEPSKILGAFFVRQDRFRIRVDDIQHFILGYSLYRDNYNKLIIYQDRLSH